jgi:hypothetical protein
VDEEDSVEVLDLETEVEDVAEEGAVDVEGAEEGVKKTVTRNGCQ